MATALITGATAGIGHAFARRLAADGHDLVLVARDYERLERTAKELHEQYGIDADVLVADLVEDEGLELVEARLRDRDRPIDMLINNAGFSVNRRFIRGDIEGEERMLRILVLAVMRLTHAALPGMIDRGHGGIINVSSVAAFIPQGTYSAHKAWVNSFSRSIATDLAGTGVAVLVLCPGFTRTEFHERAAIDMSKMPRYMWLEADLVVDQGLKALSKDAIVCVPGPQYKVIATIARFFPVRALSRYSARFRGARRSTDSRSSVRPR
jgi:short-subunit dehydrogenase